MRERERGLIYNIVLWGEGGGVGGSSTVAIYSIRRVAEPLLGGGKSSVFPKPW